MTTQQSEIVMKTGAEVQSVEQLMPIVSPNLDYARCGFCHTWGRHIRMSESVGEGTNYFDLLVECFNIWLSSDGVRWLICVACAARLRDARMFRLLALRAQGGLQAALQQEAPRLPTVMDVDVKQEPPEPEEPKEPGAGLGEVVIKLESEEVKEETEIDIVEHGLTRRKESNKQNLEIEIKIEEDILENIEEVACQKQDDSLAQPGSHQIFFKPEHNEDEDADSLQETPEYDVDLTEDSEFVNIGYSRKIEGENEYDEGSMECRNQLRFKFKEIFKSSLMSSNCTLTLCTPFTRTIRTEEESTQTPTEATNQTILAPRSKDKYLAAYEAFIIWKIRNNVKSFSEETFLTYFTELAEKYKPTSLWCVYSMLKKTVRIKHNVDMKTYYGLRSFITKRASEYTRKVKILEPSAVEKFLKEAPDYQYLATKVALIFGITGACRRQELIQITTKDIETQDNKYIVKINSTNKLPRTFTISEPFFSIVKKYEALRTPKSKTDRFFQNFQKGKCRAQPIGINKFGGMLKDIAKYLGLPQPENYTGHSLSKVSTTLLGELGEASSS